MKFEPSNELLDLQIAQTSFNANSTEHERFKRAVAFFKQKLTEEKTFSKETEVNVFFLEAQTFLNNIQKNLIKLKEAYVNDVIQSAKNSYKIDDFWLLNWVTFPSWVVFNTLTVGKSIQEIISLWERTNGFFNSFQLLFTPVIVFTITTIFVAIASHVITYPFYLIHKTRAFKKIESKDNKLPEWMSDIEDALSGVLALINDAKNEAMQDVGYRKTLNAKRDGLEIQDEFDNRAIEKRLKIIREEAEAAIRASKSLEDQHERTELIRLKYAKEMAEIEKQAVQDSNNSLIDKLHMVQSMFGE